MNSVTNGTHFNNYHMVAYLCACVYHLMVSSDPNSDQPSLASSIEPDNRLRMINLCMHLNLKIIHYQDEEWSIAF